MATGLTTSKSMWRDGKLHNSRSLSIIRETIAMAEHGNEPVSVLSLDFKDAFDIIAHTYIYTALDRFNFGPSIINNIRKLYNGAESMVMMNGFFTSCSHQKLRKTRISPQTILFAICLDPLLQALTDNIQVWRPPFEEHTGDGGLRGRCYFVSTVPTRNTHRATDHSFCFRELGGDSAGNGSGLLPSHPYPRSYLW